jgi:hypothetical protein
MPSIFAQFEIDDYDAWKTGRFDADPAGREQAAKGHQIYRGVDDPSQVFVAVEFASADDAKAFRERLLASGALDSITVKVQPTVVDVADEATY